ncbi:hypothetical protein [Caballeronia sp. LZ043]|uniref:hypothetical protein n=1 Tax=Caballeronia sp. LZ043 TaxID=3038569 RepID=UPI002861DBFF|nr:hypothetical protein [Caballeronia sp. LZ043]MDR5826015.1 hypothetical protein [Caballeronia sp. LZ043]
MEKDQEHPSEKPDNEKSKKTDLIKRKDRLPSEFMDPLGDLFERHDANRADRTDIATKMRGLLGDDPAYNDLIVQLAENMMAIADARERIRADVELIGGQLVNSIYMLRNVLIAKAGDKTAVKRKAASLGFVIFEQTLGVKPTAARQYMRCYERFADNVEVIRAFNVGELIILAAKHVTDEQVERILAEKKENKDMTRADVKALLDRLQRQDEEIEDGRVQLENVQAMLEDHRTALDVADSEARHMRDELAANARAIVEKEEALGRLDEHYKRRQAGLSNMEKDLADKGKDIERLTREIEALRNRKPEVEIKEVPTVPAGYQSISDSVQKRAEELSAIEADLQTGRAALEALQEQRKKEAAALEAANRVQTALQDVTATFEAFAGKLTIAQLAVQASDTPAQHGPLLEALGAMLRKAVTELDAALGGKH